MNAILIMCHKNISQVKRLILRCISDQTRIILHIDKSYQLTEEEAKDLAQIEQLYFTDKRYKGTLDDRSLVDIAMEMIQKAKDVEQKENIHFDYYCLLSGQDYLTKPIEYINNELKAAYPAPFIDCTPYDKSNWIYHKFNSNAKFREYNSRINKRFPKRNNIVRKFLKLLVLLLRKAEGLVGKTDFGLLKKQGIEIYGGSAWWILPDIAIDYIHGEYKENTREVQLVLNSYTPEETFFQIMTMRSPVRDRVHINPKEMVAQTCKTWAYFFDDDKSFKGHPYIFTVKEYDKLVNKDCWIARKFDINEDSEIFDMLDTYMNDYEWENGYDKA